jgi:hypothetical protein
MEIANGCHPWVSNPRARISDLRALGLTVQPIKRPDGKTGFVVVERLRVTAGEQTEAFAL